ncbi:MAG: hypothetical protein EOM26_13235 [Alphaproteobacteria bacterium]|nr:hypothetical protein [Alphaproteobacteria bacterium]
MKKTDALKYSSEIVEKSVEILSVVVNVSTGLAHAYDEARAKELFKALHARGVTLDYQQVYDAAIKRSWSDRHAKVLAELAEKIGSGGIVQIRYPRDWGEPTADRIFAELEIGGVSETDNKAR